MGSIFTLLLGDGAADVVKFKPKLVTGVEVDVVERLQREDPKPKSPLPEEIEREADAEVEADPEPKEAGVPGRVKYDCEYP